MEFDFAMISGFTAPFMINSAESLAQPSFLANQEPISVRSRLGKTLMYFKFAFDIRGAVEHDFLTKNTLLYVLCLNGTSVCPQFGGTRH